MSDSQPTMQLEETKTQETLTWVRRHKEDLLVTAVIILGLKNRKLRRVNLQLVTRNAELAKMNVAFMHVFAKVGEKVSQIT